MKLIRASTFRIKTEGFAISAQAVLPDHAVIQADTNSDTFVGSFFCSDKGQMHVMVLITQCNLIA